MAGTTAVERIRLAIGDKPKGFKGPKREPLYVQVCPLDILELVIKTPSDITEAHRKAAEVEKERPVLNILVDDAYHLIEQAEA